MGLPKLLALCAVASALAAVLLIPAGVPASNEPATAAKHGYYKGQAIHRQAGQDQVIGEMRLRIRRSDSGVHRLKKVRGTLHHRCVISENPEAGITIVRFNEEVQFSLSKRLDPNTSIPRRRWRRVRGYAEGPEGQQNYYRYKIGGQFRPGDKIRGVVRVRYTVAGNQLTSPRRCGARARFTVEKL